MDNTDLSPFQAYLLKKKIDELSFQQGDSTIYQEWEKLFPQLHEKSFTTQQLFRINRLRRKYPLS